MVNSDLIAQNVLNTRDKVVEVNKLAVNQTRMTHEQYTHTGALSLSLSEFERRSSQPFLFNN